MDFQTFTTFITALDAKLVKLSGNDTDQQKRILSRTVKITEELGELCNEVMASLGDQRQDKVNAHSHEKLEEEFADVLITVFSLAKAMNVDIPRGLEKKMKKIEQRFKDV